MELFSVSSHAKPTNGGETKTRAASLSVMLHGFQILPAMVYQSALDHAPTDRCGDQMIKLAVLNALLQELRTLLMVSMFAKYHAQLDNGGIVITANVFLLAIVQRTLSLKTTSISATCHAHLDNGGEMKIRLANQHAVYHGYQELPLTAFQPVLDHALRDHSGDLMTKAAAPNVLHQELRTLATVLIPAEYHAFLENGGWMKISNATHLATILG